MTHASLFSGIGGPEVAAAMLGWDNAFHCEINPFGRAVLEYWFPNSISYEDITKTDFKPWRGRIDVLTGGFPCQPFSYAGQRRGQDDDRYLWPQMLRAIDEIRPAWVVGENVAGITTMVEGGVLADLGGSPTLFQEGDELHGYELEQSFTIERICRDLEQHGYSVQPMLIPAAAVGAPHRRDRIFILAADADPDRRDDLRRAGVNERESVCEGVQERNEVRQPGIADNLRPALRRAASDTEDDGRMPYYGSEGKNCERKKDNGEGGKFRSMPNGFGAKESASDPDSGRYSRAEERRRQGAGNDAMWCSGELLPQNRWRDFPAVSPVHRGNDGLPFDVDDLTISPSKWRTESLKAYGNAIVPQVMYELFKSIELCQTNQ